MVGQLRSQLSQYIRVYPEDNDRLYFDQQKTSFVVPTCFSDFLKCSPDVKVWIK